MFSFGHCSKRGGRPLPEFFDPFFQHVVPYILTPISCYVILFWWFLTPKSSVIWAMAEGNHFLFFWEVFSKTKTQNSPEKIFSRFFNQKEGLITVHGSGLPGLPKPSSVKVFGAPRAQWIRRSPNECFHIDDWGKGGRRDRLGAGVSGCNDDIVTDVNMNILMYGTLGFT